MAASHAGGPVFSRDATCNRCQCSGSVVVRKLIILVCVSIDHAFQDQFTVVRPTSHESSREPDGYHVMHCPAPCASGDFQLHTVLDRGGRVLDGNIPKFPREFSNFMGRSLVYSTTPVRNKIYKENKALCFRSFDVSLRKRNLIESNDRLCTKNLFWALCVLQVAGFTRFVEVNGTTVEQGVSAEAMAIFAKQLNFTSVLTESSRLSGSIEICTCVFIGCKSPLRSQTSKGKTSLTWSQPFAATPPNWPELQVVLRRMARGTESSAGFSLR